MLQLHVIQQMLADARRAIVRHHRKSLAFLGAVVALTFLGVVFMPRVYQSEGKLFVRYGRNLTLDPTASTGQMVSISETRESELNSMLEVLGSRRLLEKVVAAIGPENVLRGKLPPAAAAANTDLAKPADVPATSADPTFRDRTYQQAVAKLQKELEIYVPRKTNTIAVSCKSDTPELAQKIVATLMSVYLDEHVRVHHAPGSFEFFQQQTKVFEEQWQAASADLRKAKNRMGVVTIDGKRKLLEGQIADVDTKLLQNAAELATAIAKIRSLEENIALLPQWLVTVQQEGPNVAADGMRTELYKLQTLAQEKAAKYTAEHPQLIAARQQVRDLERILDDQEPVRKQGTQAVNPARQALELQLLTERSSVDSLRGRGLELTRQQQQTQQELEVVNLQEVQLASLQRGVDLAESRFRVSADKLDQARTNEQLDREKITNLSIVQPATYVSKPLGPRKLYVLALGGMVGVLGAMGIAIVAAYLDPLLKTPADITEQLHLPLVGEIPAENSEFALAS